MLPRSGRPFELALRLLAASVLVLALAQAFALDAVRALIPAVRTEVQSLGGDYEVLSLDLSQAASGSTLRLRANLAHPLLVGGQRVVPLGWPPRPPGWYQVDLNARGVLEASLLLGIIALGWPSTCAREMILRLGFALLLLPALIMIDTPLELLGNLQEAVARPWDPAGVRPLFLWDRFLEAGGNLALALVSSAFVAVAARRAVVAMSAGTRLRRNKSVTAAPLC